MINLNRLLSKQVKWKKIKEANIKGKEKTRRN
jgi:hypothetical protein